MSTTLLLVWGRRPARRLLPPAALLAAVGAWAVASVVWGGLPDAAWRTAARAVLGAAALLLGSQLATGRRRAEALLAGILVGSVALALEILVRLGAGALPVAWAPTGPLAGPAGYKNAEAALLAVGIPLAVRVGDRAGRGARAAGGAAAGVLLGALLLAQSRGALLMLVAALLVQAAWERAPRRLAALAALGVSTLILDLSLMKLRSGDLTAAAPGRDVAVYLATWIGVSAGLAAFAARPSTVHRLARGALAAGAAVVLAAALVVAASRSDLGRALAVAPTLGSDQATAASTSGTHLASLSSNGRRDAWRVAARLAADHPLAGGGDGSFARRWGMARHTDLAILQPHSLELELLAELGVVGLALFAAGAVLLVRTLLGARSRSRAAAALALGTLALGQASFDRTWTFPAVACVTLFAAGVAVGSARQRALRTRTRALVAAAGAVVLLVTVIPYLSDRELARARAAQPPSAAAVDVRRALRLDPWNAPARLLRARLDEAAGAFVRAASRYHAAASYARQPWVASFAEAGAWTRAGDATAARGACLRAARANPTERRLLQGPCAYDVAGDDWPPVRHPGRDGWAAFTTDLGCSGCTVALEGREVEATVPGGPDFADTAFAVRGIRVAVPAVVGGTLRLEPGQRLRGWIDVLELRDAADRTILALHVHEDRALYLYAPPGGLQDEPLTAATGVLVPAAPAGLRFRITLRPPDRLEVRVDGRVRVDRRLRGGAAAGAPRRLRAGIVWYDSLRADDPLRVFVGVR